MTGTAGGSAALFRASRARLFSSSSARCCSSSMSSSWRRRFFTPDSDTRLTIGRMNGMTSSRRPRRTGKSTPLVLRRHAPGGIEEGVRASEAVLDPELHDALGAAVGRDAPELRLIEVGRREAPVETVRQVERLDPKLEAAGAAQADESREARIDRPIARPFDRA